MNKSDFEILIEYIEVLFEECLVIVNSEWSGGRVKKLEIRYKNPADEFHSLNYTDSEDMYTNIFRYLDKIYLLRNQS